MRIALSKIFARFRKDEKGVTLVEYGIALTLAVAVGTGALAALGGAVDGEMDAACGVMSATC